MGCTYALISIKRTRLKEWHGDHPKSSYSNSTLLLVHTSQAISMDSISRLSQHLPPFVINLSKSQRAHGVATVVGILALLSPLNRWLSWRSANHGDTLNRWNPATELVVVTGGSSGIGANSTLTGLDINGPWFACVDAGESP